MRSDQEMLADARDLWDRPDLTMGELHKAKAELAALGFDLERVLRSERDIREGRVVDIEEFLRELGETGPATIRRILKERSEWKREQQ